jgi:D-amino-acid dehydrogenase
MTNVSVIGSGIAGITSAYYLSKLGYNVDVIEKRSNVALGTSYANAGTLSFSKNMPLSLFYKTVTAKNYLKIIYNYKKWGICALLSDTDHQPYTYLSSKSRCDFFNLLKEENLDFSCRTGTVERFEDIDALNNKKRVLDLMGRNYLSDEENREIIYVNDYVGNCNLFSNLLKQVCEKRGVKFHFETEATGVVSKNGKIVEVITDKGNIKTDKVVVTTGIDRFCSDLPLLPVCGGSWTYLTNGKSDYPCIIETEKKIFHTHFDDRYRVSTGVIISNKITDKVVDKLNKKLSDNHVTNLKNPEKWVGIRPLSPDNLPIIGRLSKYNNLFVNTGHGFLGWTNSCSSSNILADIVDGNDKEEYKWFSPERFTLKGIFKKIITH